MCLSIINRITLVLFPVVALVASVFEQARGNISWTGDIDPADPTTWTSGTVGYIGKTFDGSLTVDADSDLLSRSGYLGHEHGSTGQVTVEGTGSTWTNTVALVVGNDGNGRLNIIGGGDVRVGKRTLVTLSANSSGEIHFDEGRLSTGGIYFSPEDLTGTGTIDTHGLVTDVDLVFDATRGLNQTLTLNELPGQNIAVHLDVDGSAEMGVGYAGTASMSIFDGVAVESMSGFIGYKSGSTGTVTVDGAGSTWTNNDILYVGDNGNGTLNITGGGVVSDDWGIIGYVSGSTGTVTVDGNGSTWTNYDRLSVGFRGHGTLNITDGGEVTNLDVGSIGSGFASTGQVTVDGNDSTWTNDDRLYVGFQGHGTLNITSGGLVSVAGTLTIDEDTDGDGFIHMIDGGMLALLGEADGSLAEFLDLINGTEAIRYWDEVNFGLAPITSAAHGVDYTLEYLTEGELAGYTLLTVLAPGPAADFDGDFDVDGEGLQTHHFSDRTADSPLF